MALPQRGRERLNSYIYFARTPPAWSDIIIIFIIDIMLVLVLVVESDS